MDASIADRVFNEAGLVAVLLFCAVVVLWRRLSTEWKRREDLDKLLISTLTAHTKAQTRLAFLIETAIAAGKAQE